MPNAAHPQAGTGRIRRFEEDNAALFRKPDGKHPKAVREAVPSCRTLHFQDRLYFQTTLNL